MSLVASLLMLGGCEESYKPAAYKPAPRVGPGADPSSVSRDLAKTASQPNLTTWTSPGAVRGGGRPMPAGAYRGIGSYRGMGYRGIAAYRGIGGYRGMGGYRGISEYRNPGAYRGVSAYRGWSKPSTRGNSANSYRGY